MKENSKLVYNFVKENDGKDFTATDIANATGLGIKQVNGIVTAAFQRHMKMENGVKVPDPLMIREEAEVKIIKEDGTEGHKTVKFIRLTDAGRDFDPNTVEEKAE